MVFANTHCVCIFTKTKGLKLVKIKLNQKFLDELIWRFYHPN